MQPKNTATSKPRTTSMHRTRGRGLAEFKRKFKWSLVKWILKRAHSQHREPRVLEVGCGEGRLLLDLLKRFPGADLHGLNKEPWRGFREQKGIRKVAKRCGIFSPAELDAIVPDRLPKMHFGEASELPFESGIFDLVVSHLAFPHIERRIETVEEIYRVLRPRGMALIHFDIRARSMPEFLDREVPRILVIGDEGEVPFRRICEHWRKLGCSVELKIRGSKLTSGKKHVLLKIKKTTDGPLPSVLEPLPERSRDLNRLRPPSEGFGSLWWGHLSAYRLTTKLSAPPRTNE